MKNSKSLARILTALACGLFVTLLFGYSSGPDVGYSGVPGESTCSACHSGGTGSGSVKIAFPGGQTYTPGVAQHLIVTVADPAQRRWGFQLTARMSTSSTTSGGTFTVGSDGYTQLACTTSAFRTEQFGSGCNNTSSNPLQYIEHTSAGTRLGKTGSVPFSFTWTPPATATGDIILYVSGNAANGDGNTTGDHIYTAKYTMTASAVQTNVPAISSNGVVNAAGFQQVIEPGSWVAISGTNLSSTTRSWGASDFLNGAFPTSLDGVSVKINGNPAFVQYISPTQINVQAPNDSSTGPVSVEVTNSLGTSNVASVSLQTASPAFFEWSGKYAAATKPDYSYVGPPNLFSAVTTTPAKPGDTVILWGTGFGPTSPSVPAGQNSPSDTLATPTNQISVAIGSIGATVLGAALSPGIAGVYQIVIQVPLNAPNGDLPIIAVVSGLQSPTNIYLTVQQ